MGFDRVHHRLFIGCGKGLLWVLDTANGRHIASVPIAPDSDGVHYDADRRQIYSSSGTGVIDVVRQINPNRYAFAGAVKTRAGAATSLFVPQLGRLFLAVPEREGRFAEIRAFEVGARIPSH
jgi:hypothetical protein